MKKIMIVAVWLLVIPALLAQKKEIKKAHQEVLAGNYSSAESYLDQAKRIFAAADEKTRSEYYVVEAEMRLAEKDLDIEQIALISKSLNRANRHEITPTLQERISKINVKIKGSSATIAASEFTNKNYSNAATLYKTAYQSSQDHSHLLKAARSYLLAKEHDDAYTSYSKLINLGYTNAKTQYVATHMTSNEKHAFSSKEARDEAITTGTYKHPEVITTNSKLPEILRGITVAAIALNKKHDAVTIIDRALAKMPENKILLNQVSHFYRQLDANDKYNTIVDKLLQETPTDANLHYNSAVTSAQSNDSKRAKELYKKTLEIDPNYINAKVNLSILLLEEDTSISDEMNSLGVSETDDKRYEELKQQRITLYNELLPYLKSIVQSKSQDEVFGRKLKSITSFLGNNTGLALLQENED